jgi:hypothetical protein
MSTKLNDEELAYGSHVEYHSGKAGIGQVFRAVFLRKHERSSGVYAEIVRELGRWNNPDNGNTHIVEWVPIAAIREVAQPIADERDELRKFIDALIQDVCWGRGLPDDMDGGSVQDMAERMGVLVKVAHTIPCELEACGCEGEEVDFLYTTPWNVKTTKP